MNVGQSLVSFERKKLLDELSNLELNQQEKLRRVERDLKLNQIKSTPIQSVKTKVIVLLIRKKQNNFGTKNSFPLKNIVMFHKKKEQ